MIPSWLPDQGLIVDGTGVAGAMKAFNPDQTWRKSETVPIAR
jgi:hypothetical protein